MTHHIIKDLSKRTDVGFSTNLVLPAAEDNVQGLLAAEHEL